MQAIFEYTSMMENLDTDVVSYTTYDGGQAVASSLRMAVKRKGMAEKVDSCSKTMNPEIYSQVVQARNVAEVRKIAYEPESRTYGSGRVERTVGKEKCCGCIF